MSCHFISSHVHVQVFSFSTGTTPAFKLAVHPSGREVVAAFAHCCK